MAACDSGGDGGGGADTETIRIIDVPSGWSGRIGVYVFSEFAASGPPVFAAAEVFNFSGGVINANYSTPIKSGEYYITIQPTDNTNDGYVYFGSGNSPLKVKLNESLITLSFSQFPQYNIWR